MRPLLYRSYLDNFLSYRGEEKSRSVTLLICAGVKIHSGFYARIKLMKFASFIFFILSLLSRYSSLLLLYFFFTSSLLLRSIDRSMVKI